MHIDWWTLGLQTVNLLVLVWILSRFLFRPISAIILARQTAATRALEEAQAARSEALTERAKAKDESAHVAAERSDLLRKAVAEVQSERESLLTAARAEAEKLRSAAQAEIAQARHDEIVAAADRASRLAADIAARLLARLPDEALITGFIDGLASAAAALPESIRAGIGTDGSALHLKAARAMTPAEAEICHARLAQALGREVDVSVDVEPDLLAGLELETPHAIVRNSFKADLERIVAELTRHDQ